jgi:hypothetical protein
MRLADNQHCPRQLRLHGSIRQSIANAIGVDLYGFTMFAGGNALQGAS